LTELPEGVQGLPGQVALFADYERAKETGVPIYVINRSEKEVWLTHNTFLAHSKLEYLNEKGRWTRAQPMGIPCGMLDPHVTLKKDAFVLLRGYFPYKGGPKEKVRFSYFYRGEKWVSNVGELGVSTEDIQHTGRSTLELEEGSFDLVRAVAIGERKLWDEMDHIPDLRLFAIYQLAQRDFEFEPVRMALTEVTSDPNEKYARAAKSALEMWLGYKGARK
jgi:hypothetical protein